MFVSIDKTCQRSERFDDFPVIGVEEMDVLLVFENGVNHKSKVVVNIRTLHIIAII
jgi:hypothetical protein